MLKFFLVLAVCSLTAPAQQNATSASEPSLADRARAARKNKEAKATTQAITNESLAQGRVSSPFPELNPTRDNSEAIIAAMKKFRSERPEKETEAAMSAWFSDHDSRLGRLMEEAQSRAGDQQRRNEAAATATSAEQRQRIYASMRADNRSFVQVSQEANAMRYALARLRQTLRVQGFPEAWMPAPNLTSQNY